MTQMFKRIAVLLLALSCGPIFAQERPPGFDSLQIDNKHCNLVVQGSRNEDIVWKGKEEIGMCFVVVDRVAFESRYSFCALAGVLHGKDERLTCEFGHYDREKTQIAFTSDLDTLCQFVCMKTAP